MTVEPALWVDCRCDTGENPLWHPGNGCLYWVDIPVGRIYRRHIDGGAVETFDLERPVGGMTRQEDGALLLFMGDGRVSVWDGATRGVVVDGIPDERGNRFNDVIADPEGRVFCGTMSTPERAGRLYRLDRDGRTHVLLEGIGTSNGLGFTPDRTQLYYTDTRAHTIYRFDYDRASGAISNQRTFVKVNDGRGRPDGLTVDADGCVWSARWNGGGLIRYSPEGRELLWVPFPARNVSCLTFGGPDYTDIFVTTALGRNPGTAGEHGGALFRLNLGIRGVPEFPSRISRRSCEKPSERPETGPF